MKNLLLIAFLLMPFLGLSQTTIKPIDSFLGIKFGSSSADVIKAMKQRGSKILKTPDNNPARLVFQNVKLGHQQAEMLIVDFVDDQTFSATFTFSADIANNTLELYNDLSRNLTELYGTPVNKNELTSAYKNMDIKGNEATLIQTGDAKYSSIWIDDNSTNVIRAHIDDKLNIYITYLDVKLASIYQQQTHAKEKSDF